MLSPLTFTTVAKSAVDVLSYGDEAKSQKVQKFKVEETTPCFRNIDINHMSSAAQPVVQLTSTVSQQMPVSNIHIKDIGGKQC